MLAFSISNEIMPFGTPFLALFSLIPLYRATFSAKSAGESFWIWFVQAITVHLCSSWWLYNFHDYAFLTLGASALGTAVEAGLCGSLACILPLYLTPKIQLEEDGGKHPLLPLLRILWFTAIYLFWEWAKSSDFLGYPWGTLSMAAYNWRIIAQTAAVTGVWGISFLFCLVSALMGEGINLMLRARTMQSSMQISGYRAAAVGTAVLFLLSFAYGVFEYALPRTVEKTINTVIVQHNADTWQTSERENVLTCMDLTEGEIHRMRGSGLEPDLVLWSEGILQFPYPDYMNVYQSGNGDMEGLVPFINRMGVPFIIGGTADVNRSKGHFTNAALFFDAGGNFSGFYSKIHLVPFAEGIPYQNSSLMQNFMTNVVHSGWWTPGNQFVLFKVPVSSNAYISTPLEYGRENSLTVELDSNGLSDPIERWRFIENEEPNPDSYVTFSVPICFEDAFNDVCSQLYRNGSEVFMNITNDQWSGTASSEYQHFIAASYRAIEYRTTLVRCANSGYSVVVNPAGKIIADLPLFESAALSCEVPVYKRTRTVYSEWGDWFMYALMVFLCAVVIVLFVKRVYPECSEVVLTVRQALMARELSADDAHTDDEDAPISKQTATSAKKVTVSKQSATSAKKATVSKQTASSAKKTTVSKQASSSAKKATASKQSATSDKKATVSKQTASSAKNATVSKQGATSAKKATVSKQGATSAKKATASKQTASSAKKTSPAKRKKPSAGKSTQAKKNR